MFFKSLFLESKIKYIKGKTYQSGKNWSVYANSDTSNFSINVNNSAGWSIDVHDKSQTNFILQDNGSTKAHVIFKSGNINSIADEMFLLNRKTSWGETKGLTSLDYANILRVWLDMKKNI